MTDYAGKYKDAQDYRLSISTRAGVIYFWKTRRRSAKGSCSGRWLPAALPAERFFRSRSSSFTPVLRSPDSCTCARWLATGFEVGALALGAAVLRWVATAIFLPEDGLREMGTGWLKKSCH